MLILLALPLALLGVTLLTAEMSVYSPLSSPPIAITWIEVKPAPKSRRQAEEEVFRRQIDFLRRPTVLEAALQEPGIADLRVLPQEQDARLPWVREHVRIERDNRGLARITVQGCDEQDARALVNAVVRACVRQSGPAPGTPDRPHITGEDGIVIFHPSSYLFTVPVLINDPLTSHVTGCILLALALILAGIAWWIRPADEE